MSDTKPPPPTTSHDERLHRRQDADGGRVAGIDHATERTMNDNVKNILLPVVLGLALGWFLPNVFVKEKVWCLPYEISQEEQAKRGLEMTEVGSMFAPDPGVEHKFWCYQKK